MGYFGSGFIEGRCKCGVQYRFQDQFYDVDKQIQDICKVLWDRRVNHNIRFDSTSGNTTIYVPMMSEETYDIIEPIYQSAYVYNPKNKIRRKTKEEAIENPHVDVPEACAVMIKMYGSTINPYRNGFVAKVYGYLYKYFYHQHWIHEKDMEKNNKEFIKLVSKLSDEEITMIPGIGTCTKPLIMMMRDDILAGKFKLTNRKRYSIKKKAATDAKLRKMAKEAKVIDDWGEFEKKTYKEYNVPLPENIHAKK